MPVRLTGLLLAGLLLGASFQWKPNMSPLLDQMVPCAPVAVGHAAEAPALRGARIDPGDDTFVLDQLRRGARLAGSGRPSKQAFAAADSRFGKTPAGDCLERQGLAGGHACSPTIRPWLTRAPDYERTTLHHYLAPQPLQRGCRRRPAEVRAVPTRCRSRPQTAGAETRKAVQGGEQEDEAGKTAADVRGAPEPDRLIGQVKTVSECH